MSGVSHYNLGPSRPVMNQSGMGPYRNGVGPIGLPEASVPGQNGIPGESETLDQKPCLVGNLISDEAWNAEWSLEDMSAYLGKVSSHVTARTDNHSTVSTYLDVSAREHRSISLDIGHERSRNVLYDDKAVTTQYDSLQTVAAQIADFVQTHRKQMVSIAAYEENRAQSWDRIGKADKAEEIREAARSEIDGIGLELTTLIAAKIASHGAQK